MTRRTINPLRKEIGMLRSQLAILKSDYDRQLKINANLREKITLIQRVVSQS